MTLCRDHMDLIRILLVCATGLTGHPALAEWRYQAGVSTGWHQVSEYEDGDRLVEEQGWMTGLSGILENRQGGWRTGVAGEYLDGSLDYDGATQLGFPLQTDTDWQHRSAAAFIDRNIDASGDFQLGGLLEYEWRNRDVASTASVPGLEERYDTVWLGLRGRVPIWRSVSAEINFACALDATVDVSFDSDLDDASVDVDEFCRAAVSARADIHRSGRAVVFVQPFAAWERYPRTASEPLTSGGVPVGRVHLPETEFLSFGVTVGITRQPAE